MASEAFSPRSRVGGARSAELAGARRALEIRSGAWGMTDIEQIPEPTDSLRTMLKLLAAVIREGGRQERIELVALSERCKVLVEDALRRGTN